MEKNKYEDVIENQIKESSKIIALCVDQNHEGKGICKVDEIKDSEMVKEFIIFVDNMIPGYGSCCGRYILRCLDCLSKKLLGWLDSGGDRLSHIRVFLCLSRIRFLSIHTTRHQAFHCHLHL